MSLKTAIRQALLDHAPRPLTAHDLWVHLPVAESSAQIARELHAMRKAGDVEAIEQAGKRAAYRLTGQARAQMPEEPPAAPAQPTAPLRQPARRAARARPAAEPAAKPPSPPPSCARPKPGRTPGTVPGAPDAQTLRDVAARLEISIGAVRGAVAAGVVPAEAVKRGAKGMRVYGIVPSPELDAALKEFAANRALRHGGNRHAPPPTADAIPARVQIAAIVLAGYSHFNHSQSEDEHLVRAALRRTDLLLSLANE